MKIKPLKNRVIIEPTLPETKTASGIIIPETARERPKTGIVVAVGKTVDEVAVGDNILYNDYSGKELKKDGKIYLIMDEDSILAIDN